MMDATQLQHKLINEVNEYLDARKKETTYSQGREYPSRFDIPSGQLGRGDITWATRRLREIRGEDVEESLLSRIVIALEKLAERDC